MAHGTRDDAEAQIPGASRRLDGARSELERLGQRQTLGGARTRTARLTRNCGVDERLGKVLLVDSDEAVCRIIKRDLTDACEILDFGNRAQGARWLIREGVDLIIVDVN